MLNPAIGGAGRDFANAVALVESELDPDRDADRAKADRARSSAAAAAGVGAARVLDLDIVAWERRPLALPLADHPPRRDSRTVISCSGHSPRSRRRWRVDGGLTRPPPRSPPWQAAARAANGAALVGPLAQSVEQLTFNQ